MKGETLDITMRRARREDVPAIVAMLADDHLGRQRERLEGPFPEAYMEAFDAIDEDPRNVLAVAENADGAVIGALQLTFIPGLSYRGAERALVESVRVAGPLRGRGVGSRMLQWAIDEARRRGCRMIRLSTHQSRTDAQRFYKSLGFVDSHVGMTLRL
jgi:GNAT superfamily N-acetyltransferase